jgi:hypothetical protein
MRTIKVVTLVVMLGVAAMAAPQAPKAVIRSGAITLKVPDFGAARAEVSQVALNCGGQVAGGQARVSDKGRSHGWLRLVVPESQLDRAMTQLRSAGGVYGESLAQHDLAPEVQELASRTVRLQQHQDRLSGVLRSPRQLRGSDILFFQERLFRAGLDQDLLGHRREQMISSTNMSNISVYLFEPNSVVQRPPIPRTLGEKTAYAFGSAWKSFSKFAAQLGLLAAGIVVYGIVWIPILLLAILIWRKLAPRLLRLRRPPTVTPPMTPS